MNVLDWFARMANTMDVADVADIDRMSWDATYRDNMVHTLESGGPTQDLHAEALPSFPPAMRRMVAHFGLDEGAEWQAHEADMRAASRACDGCPDYAACLKAAVPLVHLCPNRARFQELTKAEAA